MEVFRRTLEECQFGDIGFSGAWFTWEIGHVIERNIRERICLILSWIIVRCLLRWRLKEWVKDLEGSALKLCGFYKSYVRKR